MDTKFLTNYRVTLFALSAGLAFAFICLTMFLLDNGRAIFLLLYTPGLFFGIAMFFALKSYTGFSELIIILSAIEYLAIIFFCSKSFEYLEIRRILMGGIGALIFLSTIKVTSKVQLNFFDFVLGFVLGILTTVFMWTDNFQSFDPWLTILSVVLWQTVIAALINRRLLLSKPIILDQ